MDSEPNGTWTLPDPGSPELAHISRDLRRLAVPVATLLPDPDYVRVHPERNMAAVMASLRKYGQRKPVVVNDRTGVIEAGNGTTEGLAQLGYEWVARVRVSDDELAALGYAIADNRTAELADWNYQDLSRGLASLVEAGEVLGDLGFIQAEFDSLLGDLVASESEGVTETGSAETYVIKVEGVKPSEKDEVLAVFREALANRPHLSAEAY